MTAHQDEPFRPLSPRMAQIAELIAEGQSNPAIARRLGISVATVKNRINEMVMLFTNPDKLPARHVIRLYVERRRRTEHVHGKLAQG